MPGNDSKLTPELIEEICRRLSTGETLSSICRDPEIGVTRRCVNLWRREHDWVAKAVQDARDVGFDEIAEECLDIADDARNDWMEKQGKNGTSFITPDDEVIQRSKLRVWTRLQLLAKWDPKRYGDKQQVEHSGELTLEQLVTASKKRAAE